MAVQLALHAKEESTYAVQVRFVDDAGTASVPTSATWTLSDPNENIINSRSNIAITPLAATVTIVLTGDDLAVVANGEERYLLVEAVYDSATLGNGLANNDECRFVIDKLHAL
jgi:hypothetical protein